MFTSGAFLMPPPLAQGVRNTCSVCGRCSVHICVCVCVCVCCVCVCTYLDIVDVPVVVYGGSTVIHVVELAPYLDIF